MNPKRVRKAEQVELIMECRRSGLSDYQWCQNHGIHPGTFYNWVSKLRKAGYQIPDSESRTAALPVKQEVVKLEMVESTISTPVKMEQNVSPVLAPTLPEIAAEIECRAFKVRFYQGADAALIQNILHCIGGMSHDW
ncbi:MAG: transposase [Acetatifactor sp.]|nr:transposase [Acetatifactor sp.]